MDGGREGCGAERATVFVFEKERTYIDLHHCDSNAQKLAGKKRHAVIPYLHRTAHGLKNVGSWCGVNMPFSARNRVGKVCTLVLCRMPGTGLSPFISKNMHLVRLTWSTSFHSHAAVTA